jgi:lysozyme family protein
LDLGARLLGKREIYNGFGPRNHGRRTGYLWAGTNIYNGGKYIADGEWDPNAKDTQMGMIPLMVTMLQLDPTLALADALPTLEAAIA